MLENVSEINQALQTVPGVEVVSISADEIDLKFKPDHIRTGAELLEVQKILFNFKIFNFIKSEKVDLWSQELREIKIYL